MGINQACIIEYVLSYDFRYTLIYDDCMSEKRTYSRYIIIA